MASTAFTLERYSTQHLLLLVWEHGIYSWETESTTYTHKKLRTQYLLQRDRVHDISSWAMESTKFTLNWWSTQHLPNDRLSTRHLLMTDGVHRIYSRERWIPQHLLSWEMDWTTFTNKKWSPHNLFNMDGVNSIDTQEMESTAFPNVRWIPQHLHIRYAIIALLPFPTVWGEAGNETGPWFLIPLLLHH